MVEYEIIRSARKTVSVEIKRDLRVIVRAPYRMSDREAERFVNEKKDWIENHLRRLEAERRQTENLPKLTQEDINALAEKAREIIPARAAYFAPAVGVDYGRITIRNQVSRWGSCSSKGNLNFNCLLMLAPPEVLDYVVVHELCHRREMNHSKRFWSEVSRVLPDFEQHRKWLRDNGAALIERIR